MIRVFLILFFLPLLLTSQTASKKIRVLFIGNSYTYVNTLPVLVENLAKANGDTLIHDSYAPGGYSLNNHFNDPACLAKIALGNWQYVVLQAQSQEPSFSPAQVSNQTLPYVIKLDSLIKKYNSCATTVLYETWGRKNGDQANCGFYPPVCTYTGMQNRLRDSYLLFADTVHGIVSPVGEAFRTVISTTSTPDLYQVDESHPSLAGSYLAACVFYETLFQKSILANTYNPGIGTADAWYFQQIANSTVRDSLITWNIGQYDPWAGFSFTQNNLNVQFNSKSSTLTNTWYFGDGNSSQLINPNHLYAAAGNYTVSHVVSNGCKKDSVSTLVSVTNIVGVNKIPENSPVNLYPNPATDHLYFANEFISDHAQLIIRDHLGRVVYESGFKQRIDISGLTAGVYVMTYKDINGASTFKFVKTD